MVSALHPLPAPGTVEAFVLNVLEGGAAEYMDRVDRRRGEQGDDYAAAWAFLRWLGRCWEADGDGRDLLWWAPS